MERVSAWFGGLTPVMKAMVVVASLGLFAVLSPLIGPLAMLFFVVCVPVVAYRMLRRRPYQRPGIFLLGSLVVLLLANGVSGAIYGTSSERASSPSDSRAPTAQGKAQQAAEKTTPKPPSEASAEAPTETTAEPAKPPPEKAKAEAPKPEREPEPKPKPEPKSKPAPKAKPKPEATANINRSPYDATVTAASVTDGDTVEISPTIRGTEEVRLIGVDTPETVDPSEEVEPYGPEASAFAKRELTGRKVGLEFDVEKVDQYGRLLAYVYLGGSMFNEELVEKGYAQAYPYPPNTTHEGKFAAAQSRARASGIGIWGLTEAQQCELADRGNGIGEGTPGCTATASSSASASPGSTASAGSSATDGSPSGSGPVAPISEDDCPSSAPVKGNQSGLYHVPGGAYYDVTNPEECFATPSDAEAAGYEASSR
jgi:micrococcal nuclease